MLERFEQTPLVSKKDYEEQVPALRVELINAQFDLRDADFAALILLAGDDRVAIVETVQLLHEWLDARHLDTHIFEADEPGASGRPALWRYWNALPARGTIGIHVGGWPMEAISDHATGRLDDAGLDACLERIRHFERTLSDHGTLILKFWIHTPAEDMARRLRRAKKHPEADWQIEAVDWTLFELFDRAAGEVERLLHETACPEAPWHVIDARDDRSRNLAITRRIAAGLAEWMRDRPEPPTARQGARLGAYPDRLADVALDTQMSGREYDERLENLQARLARLSRLAREQGQGTILVFEGWDAAGKGGMIRRITQAMAVRDYRVIPVAVPNEAERSRHYLWRFWRHLPRAGRMTIFDRSWYGRVLVERVEGLAPAAVWERAYDEIVDFENRLLEHGYVLQKFWLHIDRDEQEARFHAREQTPYKKYKITADDYRNRERWGDYVVAVNEMVARTGTAAGPWHLVPFNDKRSGRIQVLEQVCSALASRLDVD